MDPGPQDRRVRRRGGLLGAVVVLALATGCTPEVTAESAAPTSEATASATVVPAAEAGSALAALAKIGRAHV